MVTANPENPHPPRSGFLRDLFLAVRLKNVKPNFLYGITIALSMAAPVALGLAIGKIELGSLLGIFGLLATFVDAGGPLKRRLISWSIAVIGLTLSFFLAEIAGQAFWSALLFTFLVLFLAILGLKWGKAGLLCGVGLAAATLIGVSAPAPPEKAVLTIAPVFIGSIWGIIISLLLQPYQPRRITDRAISACYEQLSAYVKALAQAFATSNSAVPFSLPSLIQEQRAVLSALQTAGQTLLQTRGSIAPNEPARRRQVELYLAAERLTLATGTLTEYIQLLPMSALPAHLRLDIIEGLQGMATALHQVACASCPLDLSALDRVIATGEQLVGAVSNQKKAEVDPTLQTTLGEFASIRVALQGAAEVREKTSRAEPIAPNVLAARRRASETLRVKPLLERRDVVLIALRVAIIETAGVAIGMGFGLPKLIWITIPSFAILLPTLFSFSSAVSRTFQRTIGVFLGALVAMVLIGLLSNRISLLIALAVLLVGYGAFRFSQYAVAQLFMNPAMLLFTEFAHPGTYGLIRFRLLNTLIGCTLAFVGSYCLFPRPELTQLRIRLANALRANASYLCYVFQQPETSEELEMARRQAGIAANLAQQSVERNQGEPLGWRKAGDVYAHIAESNQKLWTTLMVLAQRQPALADSAQLETFHFIAQEMLQEAVQTIAPGESDGFIHHQTPLDKTLARPPDDVDAFTMAELQRVAGSIDDIRSELGLLLE